MPPKFECTIPKPGGAPLKLVLELGKSIIIIGANGSGKTRLGVHIESQIPDHAVCRIAAQKSLAIVDNLTLISSERAAKLLQCGFADAETPSQYKTAHRWGYKPATHFLSDYEALLQMLFANHNQIASRHLQERKLKPDISVPTTQLERLKGIWADLLPHRTLEILDAAVKVSLPSAHNTERYPGSEMSDGERAIFYFLGQCLVAPDNGVIIIDEPEGHIHRAILTALWDAIEKARPDCAFIYITHDLDFAASHTALAKYYIRAYRHGPPRWEIEEVPEDTGLPESVVVELVGSRKPILFVEGSQASLDLTIYRSQYAGFTIVPIGSCDAVIHSVASYKRSSALHWLGVRGLVDADDRGPQDISNLTAQNIFVLPVAEVENVLLLPGVFMALAEALLCPEPASLLARLTNEVMERATTNLDFVAARYTTRQLDRRLKRLEIDAKDLASLQASYHMQLTTIDPTAVFHEFKAKLGKAIGAADLPEVLKLYDNKGLLALAASLMGLRNQKELLEKVGRLLGGDQGAKVRIELTKALPQIPQ
jgi:energy-coupling factor transporter ATP-binding protein EcfA2